MKKTMYEVISVEACFIWGCANKEEAKQQLEYVRNKLGYKDAFIEERMFYSRKDK